MMVEKHEIEFTETEKFVLDLFKAKIGGRSWVSVTFTNDTFAIECSPRSQRSMYQIFKHDEHSWEVEYAVQGEHYGVTKVVYHLIWQSDLATLLKRILDEKDVTID